MNKQDIVKAMEPLKDAFLILDHTRTSQFLIKDGYLPSNVGGGFNLRNILRRSFPVMDKHNWWEQLGFEGYLELFRKHEEDLLDLYGRFPEHSSFEDIIRLEYKRYTTTDNEQKTQLKKFLQKNKNQLSLKDWFVLVTSMGLTPEVISQVSGLEIPNNLYYFIEEQRNKFVKKAEEVLYETSGFPETLCLYFDHNKKYNELHSDYEFKGKVLAVLENKNNN